MDHPLLDQEQKELRQRVVQLVKDSYKVQRSSNIIFVCGGNDETHMRPIFREYCINNLSEFEIFFPEDAMKNIFSTEADRPFDIIDFEEIVSDLSHAIVVFPEAAGSYAETGYFSAKKKIAKRCILVLNTKQLKEDSFISLGPAKKIGEWTLYHPIVQMDYENPDFETIQNLIRRNELKKYKKHVNINNFSDISKYELACIIHEIVNILTIATIDDIVEVFKIIFKNRHSSPTIKKVAAILVGAKLLKHIGEYGHLFVNSEKSRLLELREGRADEEFEIRVSLAEIYQNADAEFLALVEEARDVN